MSVIPRTQTYRMHVLPACCGAGVNGGATGARGLQPSAMLANVLGVVPELGRFSNVDLQVVYNKDSSRVG